MARKQALKIRLQGKLRPYYVQSEFCSFDIFSGRFYTIIHVITAQAILALPGCKISLVNWCRKFEVECLLSDKKEISPRRLSKGTFFSFAFDLQATLTANYHKNKNTKYENKEKKRGAELKGATF